jgi:regulator of RNase E activity RraA
LRTPPPRVVVIQDMDAAPAVGSFWGEVQANIHKALGCIGAVTNGGVRDLKEVAELGFQLYARDVLVSHAYGRMIDFGSPVEVGGLTVKTGDLVHADRHGVQLIPIGAARQIPEAAERVIARERRIIAYCQSPGFTADGLKQLMKAL